MGSREFTPRVALHEAALLFEQAVGAQRAGDAVSAAQQYVRVLELDDAHFEAHNNLGVLLQAGGDFDGALAHFEQAVRLRPSSAIAHDNRGSVLQAQREFAAAVAAHQRAIEIDPSLPQAHSNLGTALQGAGALDAAVAAFEKAIALAPHFAAAHANLGAALRERGDLTEAKACFERALALEPRNGRFHRLVATEAGTAPIGRSHLRRMEALAREIESLPVGDRIELRFALAKAYADQGDRARSFEQLREGNALKRASIEYDEEGTLRGLTALADLVQKPLIESMAGGGDLSGKPIFIFGMPRSGTTLVEQVLAAHPEVHAAGEEGVFERALRQFCNVDVDPNETRAFAASLAVQLQRLGSRAARHFESLAPTAKRITDKWPWSFKYAGLIHLALPNARMIHVIRDPLDTCFSCYGTLFVSKLPYMYDLSEIGRYYRGYQRLMEHWNAVLPPGSMLEIRYERLVDDFGAEARRMLEYCGLEWDERCGSFWRVRRPVRTASAVAVRQPVYRDSIGRAKAYLDHLAPLREALSS